MRVRGVDALNDWTFGKGKSDYKTGVNAVAQNIKTRLQSFLADCFFEVDAGIDWFNLMGSKSIIELRLKISATILNTPEVISLVELSFNLSPNRRIITITYSVETVYGRLNRQTFTQGI